MACTRTLMVAAVALLAGVNAVTNETTTSSVTITPTPWRYSLSKCLGRCVGPNQKLDTICLHECFPGVAEGQESPEVGPSNYVMQKCLPHAMKEDGSLDVPFYTSCITPRASSSPQQTQQPSKTYAPWPYVMSKCLGHNQGPDDKTDNEGLTRCLVASSPPRNSTTPFSYVIEKCLGRCETVDGILNDACFTDCVPPPPPPPPSPTPASALQPVATKALTRRFSAYEGALPALALHCVQQCITETGMDCMRSCLRGQS